MPMNQPVLTNSPGHHTEKKLWVIVPAAGSGQRFSQSLPPTSVAEFQSIPNKLLLPLPTGRLVLQEVIYRLGCVPCVAGIVVLSPEGCEEQVGQLLANSLEPLIPASKRLLLTAGGANRRASVLAGLEAIALADPSANWVAVHDAARPFVDGAWLEDAFSQLQQVFTDGIVGLCAGTKVQDTVKACAIQPPSTLPMADSLGQLRPAMGFMPVIINTVDRSPLWQVQTPQLFSFSAVYQAHKAVDATFVATDDAQLIELAGLGSVLIKQSATWNLKLTTWTDYQLLETLMRSF
ncbi:MAG: 2-C-methyl-D-erythritol 4-phosphate cytidylyltransferase [Vampirovibrio sp.]|nr:2-C-methyl-D-erythritol 4-phosphate cytidylyltransferase [Vampirovibrio sp.]